MKVWLVMRDSGDNSYPCTYTEVLKVCATPALADSAKEEAMLEEPEFNGQPNDYYVAEWDVEEAPPALAGDPHCRDDTNSHGEA